MCVRLCVSVHVRFKYHTTMLAKCSCIYYHTQRFLNKHLFFVEALAGLLALKLKTPSSVLYTRVLTTTLRFQDLQDH